MAHITDFEAMGALMSSPEMKKWDEEWLRRYGVHAPADGLIHSTEHSGYGLKLY